MELITESFSFLSSVNGREKLLFRCSISRKIVEKISSLAAD